jgi:hypothetical protein
MNSDSQDSAYLTYYIIESSLVALTLYFLYRAIRAEYPSRRFSNLALCCGFAGGFLVAHGDVAAALAGLSSVAGMTLAVMALFARRREQGTGPVVARFARRPDQGPGVWRPIFGFVVCLLALLLCALMFLYEVPA